jgi:hypothetical protein
MNRSGQRFPCYLRRLQFGHNNIHQVAESVKKLQTNAADKSSILTRRLQVVKGESVKSLEISDIDVGMRQLRTSLL